MDAIIKNGHNYSKFLDNTLAAKIIKNMLKKEDVQRYLRNIFYGIITDIIEMENKNVFMEPNRIRLNPSCSLIANLSGKPSP